jgi:hypothetical protein
MGESIRNDLLADCFEGARLVSCPRETPGMHSCGLHLLLECLSRGTVTRRYVITPANSQVAAGPWWPLQQIGP